MTRRRAPFVGFSVLLIFPIVACVGDDPAATPAADAGALVDAPVTSDAATDAGGNEDATGDGCSPTAPFGAPVVMPELDGFGVPRLTGDELLVLFDSAKNVDGGQTFDLFLATRTVRSSPFGTPVIIAAEMPDSGITGPDWEIDPSITADGLKVAYRQHSVFAGRDPGIYVATRAKRSGPFDEPFSALERTTTDGGAISQVFRRYPFIVPDGSAIYVTANYGPTDVGLERWSRKQGAETFVDPVVVPELAGAGELVTNLNETSVFYANRLTSDAIWTASRASKSDPWTDVHPIPELTFAGEAVYPGAISNDGCRLYFHRASANEKHDYVATRGK